MKKIVLLFALVLCVFNTSIFAQVAMGEWRTHFAYNSVTQIAQSENKIYAVSEGALYSVDKYDGGIEFYSKLSGLNGTDISRIEFDTVNQQLVIIYTNGNIDVMGNGGVVNIPDLYNKQMSANKEINHIYFYNGKAYLSCNFGIIVLNLTKNEVADTYIIGPNASEVKVLCTTVHNDSIYAVTSTDIFKASINESFLVNYEFWSKVNSFPGSGDFQSIGSFSGNLILLRGGKLYKKKDNVWSAILPSETITNFNISGTSLNAFTGISGFLIDDNFTSKALPALGTITDAKYDVINNTYWFAGNELGVVSYKQTGTDTPEINYFKPDGPAVNIPWSMIFSGQKLFVVPGGRWAGQYGRSGDVMMYEDGIWTNILSKTINALTNSPTVDFVNTAVDPSDNKHFFVTSYGTGLYEFKNNEFTKWHNHLEPNTTIETVAPNDPFNYIRLDGAVYDNQGNLWFDNMVADGGEIKVLMKNGTWDELYFSGFRPTLGQILISNQNANQKWVPSVRYTPGILIFDDNATIADKSDDKSTFYYPFTYTETDNNQQTVLVSKSPTKIYTIAQDKNGVVWVGTDMGPFLFNNLSTVFNSDYTCSRVKIPREDSTNLADYLLVDETIKSISIDGANRKWIGTESSGVYLMSESGQETIQHFTTANSPLLSNDILSIAINPVTGEVFFGTSLGIVSYQSDASEAEDTFTDVHAYPNPVRENFNGVITITGLVQDTQVKITDLNGNLVCETISNGSVATWDGKDVHGRKVSTGIYLAICASSDGTQSAITKILVIN
ncbi:MAG: two-component regulator propeller domain-containing protein [Paludibacter sp.]|nr:two-component regulator propeller domain-containing protein [Paludibacter sp.]